MNLYAENKKLVFIKPDNLHTINGELYGYPIVIDNQILQGIIINNNSNQIEDKIIKMIQSEYGNRIHKTDFVMLLVKNGYKNGTINQYLKLSNKSGWLNRMIGAGHVRYENDIIIINEMCY